MTEHLQTNDRPNIQTHALCTFTFSLQTFTIFFRDAFINVYYNFLTFITSMKESSTSLSWHLKDEYVWDWQMWCEEVKSSVFWAQRCKNARPPNERLCRVTESKWLADGRVDLADLWYCKSSVKYGSSIKNFLDYKSKLKSDSPYDRSQWSYLTLWRPLLTYGYSTTDIMHPVRYRFKPVICNFWQPGTLTLSPERQSAQMSRITNDGLIRSAL